MKTVKFFTGTIPTELFTSYFAKFRGIVEDGEIAVDHLTNGELTEEETIQQQQPIPNGDVLVEKSKKISEEMDEPLRIVRHLEGLHVSSGTTATFLASASGTADEVILSKIWKWN